jgi:hypothetical protein
MTTPEQGIVDVSFDDLKTVRELLGDPTIDSDKVDLDKLTQNAIETLEPLCRTDPLLVLSAQNCINHIYRNILPGVIYKALRDSQPTLRMLLSKISKPLKGGLDHPITQPVPSQSSGNWTDWSGRTPPIQHVTKMPKLMQFSPALCTWKIFYPRVETMVLPSAVVGVVKQRIIDAYQQIFTDLDKIILFGSVCSNNSQILGLKDIVDNGTNQSTYGGLSRADYAALNSQIYNMSSYTSLSTYQVINLALNSFLNDVNQKSPDVGITSFAVFNALTTSIPNKDISTTRDRPVQPVSVNGVLILPDPNITTNDIIFLNLEKLDFGFIPQLCFKATEAESMLPAGQLGYVQAAMIAGQLYSFEPSAHFMAINIPVSQSLL